MVLHNDNILIKLMRYTNSFLLKNLASRLRQMGRVLVPDGGLDGFMA